MAVTATQIDGNNVALGFSGSVSANVFSLNAVTGTVTSNYLSDTWVTILKQNALKLFDVTSTAQRKTVQFLDRLIALGSLDDTTISTTVSVAGNVATLVVTVAANTTVLVQLPHSIFGAASLGQSVPAAAGGGGGGTLVPGDLGLVRFTGTVDPAVGLGDLVSLSTAGVLVRSDKTDVTSFPCCGAYQLDSALAPCVRSSGEVTVNGGPFAPGATLYVGTAGAPTTTPTTTHGEVRQLVGVVQSNGLLFLSIGLMEVI